MKSFFSIIPLLVSAALAAPAVDLVSRDTVSVHFTDTAKTYYGEVSSFDIPHILHVLKSIS